MKRLSFICFAPLLVVLVGCEASKSSTPLSPSVAGPIPGVEITAPKTLEPVGTQVPVDKQPVTLLIENASSTGPRPLTYAVDVAADVNFAGKVFQQSNIPPGEGGRTALRLPDPLAPGRSYYWRVRAEDGANVGPYSPAVSFEVFTPIEIEEPILLSPIQNVKLTTRRPKFVFTNARRTGPVGPITYTIEFSNSFAFVPTYTVGPIAEQPSQTTVDAPTDAPYEMYLFWHVRASDGTHTGPWSATQAFQTPDSPPPPPPPTAPPLPGGGNWENCGSTPGDALSRCVHAAVNPARTVAGAFEVTKRIAWLLRGSGGGLLIKNGGENILSWKGYSFSAGRICFPDGHIWKVLTDIPTTNGPSWQDNDFVDRSLYVPAIDPR